MSILSLVRDYGTNPAIVRMQTNDNYVTMTAPGYITSQMADFNKINGGPFQWSPTDMILCYYLGNWQFFILTPDMTTLLPYPETLPVVTKPSSVLVTDASSIPFWQGPLTNGQLIIGSTGLSPAVGSLTAGVGITITPGAGTITISAGGGGGIGTIDGDVGSVTGATVIFTGGSTGLTFNGAASTMTVDGVLLGNNGGTGISNSGLTIDLHTGGAGKVLTSDAFGNATWATPSLATSTTYVNSPSYNVQKTDDIVLVDTVAIGIPSTITLIASPLIDGQVWTIKDFTGSASIFNITVNVAGGANLIDGAATFVLSNNYESVGFAYSVSQGTYSVVYDAEGPGSNGISLTGDSGTVSGNALNLQAFSDPNFPNQSGSSVTFFADTTTTPQTMVFSLADNNSNIVLGTGAGSAGLVGSENTVIGSASFSSATGAANNVGIGYATFGGIIGGSYNIAIGYGAGNNYNANEQANILLAHGGIAGESNVMRLGNLTGGGAFGVNTTFIQGVYSNSQPLSGSVDLVTINTSTGQLGVTTTSSVNTWSDQAVSFPAVAGYGYIATAALTATLPTGTVAGQTISFIVDTAGTFIVQAAGGQFIRLGSAISAANGTATNNAIGDTLTLVYSNSSTSWIALNDIGNAWAIV